MKLEQVLARWARSAPPEGVASRNELVSGRWTNEYGSVVDIKVDGDRIGGTYTSAVGSKRHELTGPITGFARGDTVTFSVLWPAHLRSLTTWVGQVVDSGGSTPVLKTLWYLIVDVPDADEPTGLWTAIHAGADEFR